MNPVRFRSKIIFVGVLVFFVTAFFGCQETFKTPLKPKIYAIPEMEAEWIRKGEPLEFENELWYPMDSLENFQDQEMYYLGVYRDVEFFVEKADVLPYSWLYTKFGRNKFRPFEKEKKQ